MNYQEEKAKLLNMIRTIEIEEWNGDYSLTLVNEISTLKNTIENDFFTVVVLGEFKRGKSTFINALLETELLPTNVTPTTATINALMYSEEKLAEVVFQDGSTETGAATLAFLEGFTADGGADTTNINYIKVGYPSELLRNQVILVDTPGVSDINQQRVQVTYDFIPKADVVIFLLDATSPLKRTEKEFIEDHLLKIGMEKIIFIANRFDELEEEEEEEVLADIKKRLNASFKQENIDEIHVIPFSALQALQGVVNQNNTLIEESKLPFLKEKIQSLIYEGTSPENKLKSYTRKLSLLLEALGRQTEQEQRMITANVDELEEVIARMNAFTTQEVSRKQKLEEYASVQKKDMLAMIRKSLQFFQQQLKEEVLEGVESYRGTEFKSYIEKQMVSVVQKRIAQWVSTHTVSMNQMLAKLNAELAAGLARHFNTSMNGNPYVATEFQGTSVRINIEADDLSNVTMKAGLIAGGAAGLLLLAGGPLLIPIVGLAGMPFLQKTMLDQKLKEAKDKIIPEIISQINQTFNTLYGEIEKNIEMSISQILELNEQRFMEIFHTYLVKVESEVEAKRSSQDTLLADKSALAQKSDVITTLLQELKRG